MKLSPTLAWTHGDPPVAVDPRLLPLLQGISDSGSLAAAVETLQLSYRAAWGLLRSYEARMGAALVALSRGRGARLTPLGERLLQAHRNGTARLADLVPALTVDLRPLPSTSTAPARHRVPRLVIAASHDLALAALRDDLARSAALAIEIAFMGSLHALERFHAGDVTVAGFHVPIQTRGSALIDLAPFRRLLRVRRDRLLRFVDREQGLILARGNPRKVRSFRDVAARQLRFVNRQRGSGTRILIDALLTREHIAPARIDGYGVEEFTHRAVAATIAAGGAEAGFGLRAAADELGLGFVPLTHETYYLALTRAALRTPAVSALVAYLRAPGFAALVRDLPGYRGEHAGTPLPVTAL
ncbi:MAG: substrate-binding domain-containing protein [Casimicrobiaceae bacterium]